MTSYVIRVDFVSEDEDSFPLILSPKMKVECNVSAKATQKFILTVLLYFYRIPWVTQHLFRSSEPICNLYLQQDDIEYIIIGHSHKREEIFFVFIWLRRTFFPIPYLIK